MNPADLAAAITIAASPFVGTRALELANNLAGIPTGDLDFSTVRASIARRVEYFGLVCSDVDGCALAIVAAVRRCELPPLRRCIAGELVGSTWRRAVSR